MDAMLAARAAVAGEASTERLAILLLVLRRIAAAVAARDVAADSVGRLGLLTLRAFVVDFDAVGGRSEDGSMIHLNIKLWLEAHSHSTRTGRVPSTDNGDKLFRHSWCSCAKRDASCNATSRTENGVEVDAALILWTFKAMALLHTLSTIHPSSPFPPLAVVVPIRSRDFVPLLSSSSRPNCSKNFFAARSNTVSMYSSAATWRRDVLAGGGGGNRDRSPAVSFWRVNGTGGPRRGDTAAAPDASSARFLCALGGGGCARGGGGRGPRGEREL